VVDADDLPCGADGGRVGRQVYAWPTTEINDDVPLFEG
jgi:hypothetical protein